MSEKSNYDEKTIGDVEIGKISSPEIGTSTIISKGNDHGSNLDSSDDMNVKKNFFESFIDGFKQYELSPKQKAEVCVLAEKSGQSFEEEAIKYKIKNSPLSRSLKGRHLQMIAIGGSIGTGLFVGSGVVLATGGPAAVVIGYILIGIMLYCTVHALGELAVLFPVAGSFSIYSSRFIDPAWGFSMGWNYALQWLVSFPLELVAASMTIQYWNRDISPAAWVAIFWFVVVCINLFGVKGYGEAEFVFSIIKVVAVCGFIILGIVLVCGGGPNHHYYGTHFYHDPGAFAAGFKGLCSVFVTAAFSFSGTELVGLAAAESENPRKSLPHATKQVFWRIALFYIISLTLVGLLVPYNDPELISGSSNVDAKASPFVISIKNAGISGLPSVINAVILISVLSVGNSAVFGCSRTIAALAQQGMAPSICAYIDRQGRPIVAVAISLAFGLLGFLSASSKEGDVFTWMLALSGLSSIFTWASICLSHILFRYAWKLQGHSLDEIPFTSQVGVIGSGVGFIMNILVLMAQFWTGLFPIGEKDADAKSFFEAYLAAPVALVFYIGYKIIYKTKFVTPANADLVSGRREVDLDALKEELRIEREEMAKRNIFYRIYSFWC